MASFSNNTNTPIKNNDSVVNDTESSPAKVENLSEVKSFDELDIPESLLRGIYSHGFENPSPIQGKAINPVISGRDVIAQAQSGTGKTACFTISSLV